MDERKIPIDSILEEIMRCSYLNMNKDEIVEHLFQLCSISNGIEIFIFKKSGEILLKCKYNIKIPFKSEIFDIPLIIYFNKYFPVQPPEIFIEKILNTEVNFNNKDIDLKTYQVLTPYLRAWPNLNSRSMVKLSEDLYNSFITNFPLYTRASNPLSNTNNNSNLTSIKPINPNSINQIITSNVNNPTNSNILNISNQINDVRNINKEFRTFTDGELKDIFINEIKVKIESKLKDQFKNLKGDYMKLQVFMRENNDENQIYKTVINNEKYMKIEFEKLLEEVNQEINYIRELIVRKRDLNERKMEIDDFIQISNKKFIQLIAIEATIEDFISIIKKAAEKEILKFNDSIRFTRSLMRELFKIKFYREKLK